MTERESWMVRLVFGPGGVVIPALLGLAGIGVAVWAVAR